MSIFRILAITNRVVLQFIHDHRTLGLIFIAPLLIMALLGYVFRQQESTKANIAILNEDKPPAGQASLSGALIERLRADKNLVIKDIATRAQAEDALKKSDIQVALIFPEDFTAQVTGQRKSSIEAVIEGSNPSEASQALASVSQAVMQNATVVLKALVPAPLSAMVPDSPPITVALTRLYGKTDLKPLDYFAPMFIAYIGFFLVFLLTSVSFLRERTQGTMERISASPVTRIELVLGYMLGFGLFSVIQAAVLVLFTVFVLRTQYSGQLWAVFVVTLALVLGAVNLGILLSAFARNELQAIQFIPIVILPQVFLSGLLLPLSNMPEWLQAVALLMPLTYAIDALTSIMVRGQDLATSWLDLTVLVGFAAVVAVLAASSVRREVA